MLRQRFFFFLFSLNPPSPYSLHYTLPPPPVFSFPHGELTWLDLKLDDTSQIAACQDAITCTFQFAGSNRSACRSRAEWGSCCGGLGHAVFSPLCVCQSPSWPETSSFLFGWLFDQLSVGSEWGQIYGKEICFTAFVTGPQGSVCRRTHNYDITQITWRLLWGHRFIVYCWNFLSPKFTLQSSVSMKSRRANLLHFLLFAKKHLSIDLFFFFENVGIRLTVKGQKYKSCFLVEILLKLLIQDVSSENKLVSFLILVLKWTVYWKTNWKMINIRIFCVLTSNPFIKTYKNTYCINRFIDCYGNKYLHK